MGSSVGHGIFTNRELASEYLCTYLEEANKTLREDGQESLSIQTRGQLWNGSLGIAWTVLQVATALSRPGDESLAREINHLTIQGLSGVNRPFTSTSLFYGSAGFLFYLCDVVDLTGDARDLLEKVASNWLCNLSERCETTNKIGWSDGIGGLLGLARRLTRCEQLPEYLRSQAHEVGLDILRSIISSSQLGDPWFVPATAMGDDPGSIHEWYVNGQYPVGVAHGAAGLLLNLSLSATQDFEIPNLGETVEEIRSWIIKHALLDDGTFAGVVGADCVGTPDIERLIRVPNSWCNGSDGIAAALGVSLSVTSDPALALIVNRAFEATSKEPLRGGYLASGICHGEPGLALLRCQMNTPDAISRTNQILSQIKGDASPSMFLFDGTSGTAHLALNAYSGKAGGTELMLLT